MKEKTKERKKIKTIIIILIIIIIYFLLAFAVSEKTKENKKYENLLIINRHALLTLNKGQWSQINKLSEDLLENNFSIYDDEKRINDIKLQFISDSNKWYFFEDDYNELIPNKFRYAFKGFKDIKPAKYTFDFLNDDDMFILSQYLSKKGYNQDNFKSNSFKYTFDIENDGKSEIIYTTTNINLDLQKNIFNYSGIFMVKDDKIIPIADNSEKPYSITEILDIDNDGYNEIIVIKDLVNLPTFSNCYQIYDYKNNKWKIIKNC